MADITNQDDCDGISNCFRDDDEDEHDSELPGRVCIQKVSTLIDCNDLAFDQVSRSTLQGKVASNRCCAYLLSAGGATASTSCATDGTESALTGCQGRCQEVRKNKFARKQSETSHQFYVAQSL